MNWEQWAPKILLFAKASNKVGTKQYVDLLASTNVSKGAVIYIHACIPLMFLPEFMR